MKKNNQVKIFRDCLQESKSDVILYIIIFVILVISLIVLYLLYGILVAIYFLLLVLFHLFFMLDKISSYINTLKINKYLINNKLENKIGNIIFWNEKSYFFTDNYILIVKNFKVNCISYQDIKSISVRTDIHIGKHSGVQEYLSIELNDSRKFDILTWSTYLVGEKYRDITDILLEKNSKIQILEAREN